MYWYISFIVVTLITGLLARAEETVMALACGVIGFTLLIAAFGHVANKMKL